MLNKIIGFSVKQKLIIGLFTLALIGYGSYQFTQLPIDAVPDITDNQVQVITIAPAFGATDIERLVTFPIEQANNNIAGLKEIRSFSRFGLSLVTIVFNDETDIYWARQQVSERLQKVQGQIPKGIGTPELGPITTGLGEIYQYVVRAKPGYEKKYNETALRTLQDWVVRRQLIGVKGVAEVSSFGGKLKQYEIAIDPNKLQSYNINMNDVFKALENNNQNTGGAYIEKGPTVLYIRSEGLVGSLDDINNISIKSTSGGTPLFIRDVADVKLGFATRYGAMCYNDQGEVSGAVVMMLKGANSNQVIKNVKERIAQIQKTLPEGVLIEPFIDRTKMVDNAIGTVTKNLFEGALIVIFILVIFLGNLRAGLLVASVIPLAMLFAVIMMNLFGVSGNLMSLGALDFGLIVDGAVIIVEAVMHRLAHSNSYHNIIRLNQSDMDKEVNTSAGKMMSSAVFGQIIILVVYLPIFSLQGIEGKMFKPMAQTVAFALLGAFILSLTYIPMMSALFLSKKVKHKINFSDRLMSKIEYIYLSILNKVLTFPKTIFLSTIALFLLAVIILSSLGGEFIPVLEEGDFAAETRVLAGSNLNTTIEKTQQAAHILKTQFPEVEKVVTKIGCGEVPTDPMPMDAADLMIILKDKKEWKSASTFNELADKMTDALSDVPGITVGFQYPVQMRFNELMTGARQDVVCKIFGENLDTLSLYAKELGGIINGVAGAKDLYIETVTGMPQIIIEYKRAAIAQFNMNISDINKVVNTAFAGQSSGLVFEGERRFDMVVRLQNDHREDLKDVQNLLVPTPQGTQVPLYQVANVEIKDGPNQIQREDAKRRIIVGFNVRGRDVQSVVNELQEKVNKRVKYAAGYYTTYGGAFENLNAAKKRLMIVVPISLLLIFILLFFAFESVKHGLLIYSAIPLSAIGGIVFLALRGMPFSISAGVGFIALFGVSVLNGIVLIAEFNRLKNEGMDDLKRIVLMGTKVRLRPVLMTAAVASLGFLPMALSTGAGAEVQRPLATVVIGGLITATLLTLFVLPILYVFFEKRKFGKQKLNMSIIIGFLFLLSSYHTSSAQSPISLQAAIDSAIHNKLSVKNGKLKVEYEKKLINSAYDIPQARMDAGYGMINSRYKDTQFGLGQTINFPTVYKSQKKLYTEYWKSSLLSVAVLESEIKRDVSQAYYDMVYLFQKRKILLHIDSIYAEFLAKSAIRLSKGESNVLEKITAETQRGQIAMQLDQLKYDIEISQLEFHALIATENSYIPDETELKIKMEFNLDTSILSQHPSIKFLQYQNNIALANIKLEQNRLLPDLSFYYSNMSMKGVGSDNNYYNYATRFQSVQFGVGIPVFYGAQKSKIAAAKLGLTISENNYHIGLKTMQTAYNSIVRQYNKYLQTIKYYETTALNNSNLISKTANIQFVDGDINYLEWVLLTNQSISIQNDYVDILKNLNDNIIQLNYYKNK